MQKNSTEYKLNNTTEFIFSNEFIGFTTIPNFIFNCKNLSYRAIGVYCSILQFQNSPTHSITIKGLSSAHKEGRDAVAKAIDELVKAGFLEKTQLRDNGKFIGVQYKVYMKPIDKQEIVPITENPVTENPKSENPSHKKKISKKENLKKENSTTTHNARQEQKKDSKESVVVENNSNKLLIESKSNLTLTSYQSKTVSTWSEEKLHRALEIYTLNDGQTFALLLKIYRAGSINNLANTNMSVPVTSAVSKKVAAYNSLDENGREYDWDEIDQLERQHIERKLQLDKK